MIKMSLNASTAGLPSIHADVRDALEELRLDEELAVARDLLEQRDRLLEVAVLRAAIEVTAEQRTRARP